MDKLNHLLDQYYDQFPLRWEEQKYLWKSVRTFQNCWDINAFELSTMIARATIDADYLMNASLYYPRDMIIGIAQREPDAVREMFEGLFDESQDLSGRARTFSETADTLRVKYKGKFYGRNYQTMNAVSTYLWLKYPEKYYFYKFSVGKRVSTMTGLKYAGRTETEVDKMIQEFDLLDEISASLRADGRLRRLLDERMDETLFDDEQLHCMAMDFAFFIRPCYANKRIKKL